MKYFDGMIPCGIQSYGVTSNYELIGNDCSQKEIVKIVKEKFDSIFKRSF